MRRLLLMASFCLAALAIYANPISESQALLLAGKVGKSKMPLKRAYVKARANQASKGNLYYVFNRGNDQGYVVVAGDDRVKPILAWSNTGNLTEEDIKNHPSINWLYTQYGNQIEWAISNLPDQASAEFERLAYASADYEVEIEPLLAYHRDRKTRRTNPVSLGQDWPFNKYCPNYEYRGKTYPTVAGCVATAISTVLRWHEWPKKPVGSFYYYWGGHKLSVDFDAEGAAENKPYDWSNMPEAVTSRGYDRATGYRLNDVQADNYGRLLRDVGYCVQMSYGPAFLGGSGAYMYNVPSYTPLPLLLRLTANL